MVSPSTVAVIDIGSNSIKVLVAARAANGGLVALLTRTIDARISAGISRADPRLGESGMVRGLEAVQSLLAEASAFSPDRTVMVATSAVRDAANGAEFRGRIRAATGFDVRILSGDEEANLIGRGLVTDPALAALRDFYVFDLGGGSLECLAFRNRAVLQGRSLQLGCVRLTEQFVPQPAEAIPAEVIGAILGHSRSVLEKSDFAFSLPLESVAVGTGGTVATVRAILAARAGQTYAQSDSLVVVASLRQLLSELSQMPLEERKQVPGLPAARADIFPSALATLIAVAEVGRFPAFRHSLHNLRYGLAADALL